MADIEKSKPEFVKRDGIIADGKYVEWLGELKQRYQRSQIKAAVQVNHSMLEFYWSLGRDIVALKAESQWGTGVLQQLSLDLKKMFPNETGFSYRNIRYMRQWYSFYSQRITNWHEHSAKMALLNWHEHSAKIEESNRHQHSDGLDFPDIFALVPWKHHVHLVSKSNSIDEALFRLPLP